MAIAANATKDAIAYVRMDDNERNAIGTARSKTAVLPCNQEATRCDMEIGERIEPRDYSEARKSANTNFQARSAAELSRSAALPNSISLLHQAWGAGTVQVWNLNAFRTRSMSRLPIILALLALAIAGCGRSDAPETSTETAGWVMRLGGTVRLPGKTKDVKSAADLPKEGYQLDRIMLNDTKVKDDDLKQLDGLRSLRSLSLYRTEVTDKAIDHILTLPNLEELELSYTRVTDEGLSRLRTMRNLNKLFLYGMTGQVTEAGVSSLQASKPGLKIIR